MTFKLLEFDWDKAANKYGFFVCGWAVVQPVIGRVISGCRFGQISDRANVVIGVTRIPGVCFPTLRAVKVGLGPTCVRGVSRRFCIACIANFVSQ